MKIVRLLHRLKREPTVVRKKRKLGPWFKKLIMMMFLSEGVILSAPYPVKNFMDGVTTGSSTRFLIFVMCVLGLIAIAELVLRFFGGYYRNGFSHRVYATLLLAVQYQIGRLAQDWYKKEGEAGFQVINQSVSEVKGLIDTLLYTMVPLILRIAATTIAFVFIMPWFGWQAVISHGF
jgi:ABC-type bacteriocin/lantibiotic exporter with double-glycine peptidase domain